MSVRVDIEAPTHLLQKPDHLWRSVHSIERQKRISRDLYHHLNIAKSPTRNICRVSCVTKSLNMTNIFRYTYPSRFIWNPCSAYVIRRRVARLFYVSFLHSLLLVYTVTCQACNRYRYITSPEMFVGYILVWTSKKWEG